MKKNIQTILIIGAIGAGAYLLLKNKNAIKEELDKIFNTSSGGAVGGSEGSGNTGNSMYPQPTYNFYITKDVTDRTKLDRTGETENYNIPQTNIPPVNLVQNTDLLTATKIVNTKYSDLVIGVAASNLIPESSPQWRISALQQGFGPVNYDTYAQKTAFNTAGKLITTPISTEADMLMASVITRNLATKAGYQLPTIQNTNKGNTEIKSTKNGWGIKEYGLLGVSTLPYVGTAAGAELDIMKYNVSRPLAYGANFVGDVVGTVTGVIGSLATPVVGVAGMVGGQIAGTEAVYKMAEVISPKKSSSSTISTTKTTTLSQPTTKTTTLSQPTTKTTTLSQPTTKTTTLSQPTTKTTTLSQPTTKTTTLSQPTTKTDKKDTTTKSIYTPISLDIISKTTGLKLF